MLMNTNQEPTPVSLRVCNMPSFDKQGERIRGLSFSRRTAVGARCGVLCVAGYLEERRDHRTQFLVRGFSSPYRRAPTGDCELISPVTSL